MYRREFLAALAAAPLFAGQNRIDRSRISAITDEIAETPAEAIDFCRKYGLRWVELRGVPGERMHYARVPEPDLKAAAKEFHDHGLKVSFLNTGLLKFGLPGTEPVRKKPETETARQKRLARGKAEFASRIDDLKQAIRAAHILGVDQIRVFAFLRVEEPAKIEQRIVDIIGEMGEIAAKENVRLLLENEAACNVATCSELASMMKLLPAKSVGINWDPLNGGHYNETPYPDGYNLLPKERIGNVQIKGRSLLDPENRLPWAGIFAALEKDGYRGQAGLETHYFDGTLIEKSHASVLEIIRIVEHS
ncbi:MAG: sugar phosphate isomerase/epimerase family protein [Bryobacteraceae bacterium]